LLDRTAEQSRDILAVTRAEERKAMRAAVRKLRVEDVEKLQALVVENFDAIEPGLTVLDARLLLGHATIDVIGVDSVGTLVLGNVGFSANEEMLLKAVEAYSWCLEYPEGLVRLYPSCQLSEDRPPRLLFVVERMPDAFHRKIKQLGFPEVDCVEFRHLEFDGVPAVYFESLLRLRRSAATRSASPVTTSPSGAPGVSENVIGAARAAGVKLPTPGQPSGEAPAAPRAADRPAPSRGPAAVVSMVSRQTAVPAAWVERPRPVEPVVLREPEPLIVEPDLETPAVAEVEPVAALPAVVARPELSIAPAAVALPEMLDATRPPAAVATVPSMAPAHVPVAAQRPERVSFKDLADSLLGAMTATQEALAHTATDAGVKAPIPQRLVLESAVEAPVASEPIVAPLEPEKVAEPVAEPPRVEMSSEDALEPMAPPALSLVEPVSASPTPGRPITETAKPAAPAMPQGFEGLKFPNDGVLTRQWMEFLSQMSTTK
jgi:hypothetical protein